MKISNQLSVLIILLFVAHSSESQNTFKLIIRDSIYNDMVYDATETEQGNFIISAVKNWVPGEGTVKLIKISPTGTIERIKEFKYQGRPTAFETLLQIDPDTFLLSGYILFGDTARFILYKMDSSFNEIQTRIYTLGGHSYSSAKLKKSNDGNFLCFGTIWDPNSVPNAFIFKISHNLDSLNLKLFMDNPSTGDDLIEKKFAGGYLFAIGLRAELWSLNGNFEKTYSFDAPHSIHNPMCIKFLNDSTKFILTGVRPPGLKSISASPNDDIAALVIDTSFNIFQDNRYGRADTSDWAGFYRNLDSKDNLSIFIGGTDNFSYSQFSPIDSWFFLNKIDTTLAADWQQYYGGDGFYVMNGLLATNDGGCLMYGTRWDFHHLQTYTNDLVIIKVNDEGQVVSAGDYAGDLGRSAIIYPNPGKDHFFIKSGRTDFRLVLTDIQGRILYQSKLTGKLTRIETTKLRPGTYFYRLMNGDTVAEYGKWIKTP